MRAARIIISQGGLCLGFITGFLPQAEEDAPLNQRVLWVVLITVGALTFAHLTFDIATHSLTPHRLIAHSLCALICLICVFARRDMKLLCVKALAVFFACAYLPALRLWGGSVPSWISFATATLALIVMFGEPVRYFLAALEVAAALAASIVPTLLTGPPEGAVLDMAQSSASTVIGFALFSFLAASVVRAYEAGHKRILRLRADIKEGERKLEAASVRDPLTGVFNLTHLNRTLELELKTFEESGYPLCVMVIEIDQLGAVSEARGRGFGDDVLSSVARTAAGRLREYDVLARGAGDAFVVLLPVCTPADAVHVADRIRASVCELKFRFDVGVTVSIGIAKARAGDTQLSIVKRAGQSMLAAKAGGCNRTVAEPA